MESDQEDDEEQYDSMNSNSIAMANLSVKAKSALQSINASQQNS